MLAETAKEVKDLGHAREVAHQPRQRRCNASDRIDGIAIAGLYAQVRQRVAWLVFARPLK